MCVDTKYCVCNRLLSRLFFILIIFLFPFTHPFTIEFSYGCLIVVIVPKTLAGFLISLLVLVKCDPILQTSGSSGILAEKQLGLQKCQFVQSSLKTAVVFQCQALKIKVEEHAPFEPLRLAAQVCELIHCTGSLSPGALFTLRVSV